MISERDFITKKMFFRDRDGKDFYIFESAVPNEVSPCEKKERIEVVMTMAKTHVEEINGTKFIIIEVLLVTELNMGTGMVAKVAKNTILS